MTPGFRRLAEDEDGCAVSAGGLPLRIVLPPTDETVTIDLSAVPPERRAALAAAMRDMVGQAAVQPLVR